MLEQTVDKPWRAGDRARAGGATKILCTIQQTGSVALEDRCAGVKAAFPNTENIQVNGQDDSAVTSAIQAKLAQDTSINWIITLGAAQALDSIKAAGAAGRDDVKIGTFDLNADAAKAVQEGQLQFCIDQQPYLQGYLSITQLYLFKRNGNVMGGGEAVLTGPSFVDNTGSEMTGSKFVLSGLKVKEMKRIADEELRKMGIVVKDIDQPIGTLSGGQRQCVAIARAVYFGARPDPRRAHRGARRQAVRGRAEVHRRGEGRRTRCGLHHPQPPPRLPRRRPLHHPQARPSRPGQEAVRGQPGRAHPADGRRRRARRALPRAVALTTSHITRRSRTMSVAVAHQGSPASSLPLQEGALEALRRGTELAVLHVVDTLDLDKTEALRAGVADEVRRILTAAGHDVAWTLHPATGEGNVAETVLRLAGEAGAEVLVIGARRRSPVGKFLLGSVTQTIILDADVPVLVVKDPVPG
jgi:nucleotide-binding universal stress UspA family protein/ABC-type dipeptide/oligopeptide/nickel transport system ATPase subunit